MTTTLDYNNYSFIIDGGLHACYRAPSQEVAEKRLKQDWPRSEFELKGVNLPSADRSVAKPVVNKKATRATFGDYDLVESKETSMSKIRELQDRLDLSETEASIIANYG